ncbi:MAG: hypothetical protein HY805_09625 [Nitrospirae bacterium]|nr:hypothetical protein [Nitrospirota bacterium]
MKLDVVYHTGRADKPACIFIHGLGVDKDIWSAPSKAKFFGGLLPLSMLVKEPKGMRTLYHDLLDIGYTVATWSQSRPVGPMDIAVDELKAVIGLLKDIKTTGILLIGHSRGGLIARQYLDNLRQSDGTAILITLSTPHHGSTMARWAVYASSLSNIVKPIIPGKEKGKVTKTLKKILDLLESTAVKELLPDSPLLKSLKHTRHEGIYSVSAGGTNPTFITIAGISILDSLGKLLKGRLPEEMTKGKGDGLVSLKSSILPFADEHLSFCVNHAEMLVDRLVRETLFKRITALG